MRPTKSPRQHVPASTRNPSLVSTNYFLKAHPTLCTAVVQQCFPDSCHSAAYQNCVPRSQLLRRSRCIAPLRSRVSEPLPNLSLKVAATNYPESPLKNLSFSPDRWVHCRGCVRRLRRPSASRRPPRHGDRTWRWQRRPAVRACACRGCSPAALGSAACCDARLFREKHRNSELRA
jgi:hypothetical protein